MHVTATPSGWDTGVAGGRDAGMDGLDVRELDFSNIYYASSSTQSPTLFRANYGGGDSDEFRGSGFKYNAYGEATAGTVSSYAAYRGGIKMFSVDGMSLSATGIVKVANTYSKTDDLSLIASSLKGEDIFKGGNGVDYGGLYGGNDTVSGKISGGLGHDYLHGESGSDSFLYMSINESMVSSSGRDTLYDVTVGDKIDLSGIDISKAIAGNQTFSYLGSKALMCWI